jgi:hypothetical protein
MLSSKNCSGIQKEFNMGLADDFVAAMGRHDGSVGSLRVHNGIVEIRLGDDPAQPGEQWWPWADWAEFVHRHMKSIDTTIHAAPPPPQQPPDQGGSGEPPVEPPEGEFALTVPVNAMTLEGGLAVDGDHVSNWGHPGQGVSFRVSASEACIGTLEHTYVAATESSDSSSRDITIGTTTKEVAYPPTTALWATPTKGKVTIAIALPKGESTVRVAIADDSPDWSNWADGYEVKLSTSRGVALVGGATVPPVETPPPDTVPPIPTEPPPTGQPPWGPTTSWSAEMARSNNYWIVATPCKGRSPSACLRGVWDGAVILNKAYKGLVALPRGRR